MTVCVQVRNDSARSAQETVQCYLIPPDRPNAARAILVGFSKLMIAASAATQVEFTLSADDFRQVNAAGERVWAPGSYRIMIGSASPGPRSVALGASAPVMFDVTCR